MTSLEKHISHGKVFNRFDLTDSGVRATFSDGSTESGGYSLEQTGFGRR